MRIQLSPVQLHLKNSLGISRNITPPGNKRDTNPIHPENQGDALPLHPFTKMTALHILGDQSQQSSPGLSTPQGFRPSSDSTT